MRVLLLSAYHSASHRYWCEGMVAALPEVDWTVKQQDARFFSWRVGASGLVWALDASPWLDARYDVVMATSLTDIVSLRAMRPALARTPTWVYFHENQFAHPLSGKQHKSHQRQWQFLSLKNAWCADWVSFNTRFNQRTFYSGARKLLRQFPEMLPGNPVGRIEARADVLPVPLDNRYAQARGTPKTPHLIVWNHRWEWDKRPGVFLRALRGLAREGVDFEVAMLGSGGGRGEVFADAAAALGGRVVAWGEAPEEVYREWIARADIGVSCALHDFQGLALLELAQAGATVVAPRRLAYPECLPGAVFYRDSGEDEAADARALKEALRGVLNGAGARTRAGRPAADPPTWEGWTHHYRERLRMLAEGSAVPGG